MGSKKTIFVGLSGGVDSSVAALRLLAQGHSVVGVFIKVWHPDFMVCNWEEERLDAMRVAAKLGIPFLTCDAETTYRDAVADYFIKSYQAGITPNPDVMCNKEVKFGAFMEFAKRHGADGIATGHYAERITTEYGFALQRGVDTNKDQSYFLWTLTPEQLAYSEFPVGNSTKEVIRTEASAAGLLTANKKDSQGICFLGHVDIPEFLSHYTSLTPGNVLNDTGQIIGTHQGAFVYTLGQRHGFTLTEKNSDRAPQYVLSKDIPNNTITVGNAPRLLPIGDTFTLQDFISRRPPKAGTNISIQTRYRQKPFSGTIDSFTTTTAEISITTPTEQAAKGQSCVLYLGEECIGGGIIS